jgi:hypothetical protein
VGETCYAGVCQGGHPVARPTVYFSETFQNNSRGWKLDSTWAIGPARASTGQSAGNPDPTLDHTSTSDNGIAGVALGGNAPTNVHPYFYLTSPVIDTDISGSVYLTFWRFLNSDPAPNMANRVEVYNGRMWVVLFESGGSPGIHDAAWSKVSFDLTPHKNAKLQVRFGFAVGTEMLTHKVSGWNVDDVQITNAVCP